MSGVSQPRSVRPIGGCCSFLPPRHGRPRPRCSRCGLPCGSYAVWRGRFPPEAGCRIALAPDARGWDPASPARLIERFLCTCKSGRTGGCMGLAGGLWGRRTYAMEYGFMQLGAENAGPSPIAIRYGPANLSLNGMTEGAQWPIFFFSQSLPNVGTAVSDMRRDDRCSRYGCVQPH